MDMKIKIHYNSLKTMMHTGRKTKYMCKISLLKTISMLLRKIKL